MARCHTSTCCDALLLYPATADLLARSALGLADDLLTTVILAIEPDRPIWVAPAMNTVMWNKPIVQQHVGTLRDQGWKFIDPVPGELTCGEVGTGAMAEPLQIADAILGSPA